MTQTLTLEPHTRLRARYRQGGGRPATLRPWGTGVLISAALMMCQGCRDVAGAALRNGTAVRELVGRDTAIVLVFDPNTCFTCEGNMYMWLGWAQQNPGRFALVLTKEPTESERRQLALLHIPLAGVLAREWLEPRRRIQTENLLANGHVIATSQIRGPFRPPTRVEAYAMSHTRESSTNKTAGQQ